jgi:hypothetical protein
MVKSATGQFQNSDDVHLRNESIPPINLVDIFSTTPIVREAPLHLLQFAFPVTTEAVIKYNSIARKVLIELVLANANRH